MAWSLPSDSNRQSVESDYSRSSGTVAIMVIVVNGSRPYRSPLRDSQVAATRRRVLDAARDLFVEQGYTTTTVAEIAATAEVSAQTIYKSLGPDCSRPSS